MTIDLVTLLLSLVGSGGVAWAAVKWFGGKLVDHEFARRLEDHKGELSKALETSKAALATRQAELQAELSRANESALGEESAERSYRYEARKRLYTAVGPLRFQLILACNQYCSRVTAVDKYRYTPKLSSYFGRSLLFRLGRVLALTELIERQLVHADFAVDPSVIKLLRFREQVLRALSSGDVPLGHPDADWTKQVGHVFRDQLPIIAVSLVIVLPGPPPSERLIRFDEFLPYLTDWETTGYMSPLSNLIDNLDIEKNVILWLRLIAIGEACRALVEGEPTTAALNNDRFDGRALLDRITDPYVVNNRPLFTRMLERFHAAVVGNANTLTN